MAARAGSPQQQPEHISSPLGKLDSTPRGSGLSVTASPHRADQLDMRRDGRIQAGIAAAQLCCSTVLLNCGSASSVCGSIGPTSDLLSLGSGRSAHSAEVRPKRARTARRGPWRPQP
jgi:hypothetical protein